MTHVVRIPFHQHDVEPGLRRVTQQNRLLRTGRIASPFDLVRMLIRHHRRIQIPAPRRSAATGRAKRTACARKQTSYHQHCRWQAAPQRPEADHVPPFRNELLVVTTRAARFCDSLGAGTPTVLSPEGIIPGGQMRIVKNLRRDSCVFRRSLVPAGDQCAGRKFPDRTDQVCDLRQHRVHRGASGYGLGQKKAQRGCAAQPILVPRRSKQILLN